MIRPVTGADLPRLLAVAQRMHAASRYADKGPLDAGHTAALFTRLLEAQRLHGVPGATFLRLAVQEGETTGLVVGMLDRVYHFGPADRLRATDLVTFNDGDPRDGLRLLDAYLGWAQNQPNVIELVNGATDAVADHARVARLYERRGFERFGAIYRKDVA